MRYLLGGAVNFTFPFLNAAFIGERRLKEKIRYDTKRIQSEHSEGMYHSQFDLQDLVILDLEARTGCNL